MGQSTATAAVCVCVWSAGPLTAAATKVFEAADTDADAGLTMAELQVEKRSC